MEQERKIKTIIDCVNVGKVFQTPEGEHEVVRNLNFSAEENEFLVLFGPGQCGKTTIINMIAGFESATTGKMLADGKKIEKPDVSRGVVFQSISLFPWMTAMQNVEYGLKIKGVNKKERQKHAQKYMTDSDKRWVEKLKAQIKDESVFEQFDFLKVDDNGEKPVPMENDFFIEEIRDMSTEGYVQMNLPLVNTNCVGTERPMQK